ncbi:MAG TPA: YbhB/YbcL family Raf kinase inhibitor-like protein [Steroidobacteraceae bacterium]|nr:YbhB/YbcL family Raf kinase inhibitor-like protein [Steroidobacteraceae bacterium]
MKTEFARIVRMGATATLLAVTALTAQPLLAQRAGGPRTPPLLMTTSAWQDGGVLPNKYTGAASGAPVSPALQWSQVPPGTRSFVLLVHDPEPVLNKSPKMDITHWLIWNIPGTSRGLPEGVPAGTLPDGSRQVSLRSNGYMGPGAPPGPYHHYTFELYALDTTLDVPQGTPQQAAMTRMAVFDAMEGHVLGKAVLVARFHR